MPARCSRCGSALAAASESLPPPSRVRSRAPSSPLRPRLRHPVSSLLCGVAPGLRRGARPGREGGRGRSARPSGFLRRRLHLPRSPVSAPRSRILDPRLLIPDPYSPIPALRPHPCRSSGGAASRSPKWPRRCEQEPSFPFPSLLCGASRAPETVGKANRPFLGLAQRCQIAWPACTGTSLVLGTGRRCFTCWAGLGGRCSSQPRGSDQADIWVLSPASAG